MPKWFATMREPGAMEVQLQVGAQRTNAVPFLISDLPQMTEAGENGAVEQAAAVQLPMGINGRIEAPNDIDCYRFQGVKVLGATVDLPEILKSRQPDEVHIALPSAGGGSVKSAADTPWTST